MLTPRAMWMVVLASFFAALVQRGGVYLGSWGQDHNPNIEFSLLIVLAYLASLIFCLRIAREHESSPSMHLAWMLFAGSSALSVIRHCVFCVQASGIYPGFRGESFYLPSQVPMAIALVLLFVGLLSMWSAISSLGLGFHAKRIDVISVTIMLLMLPPILLRDPEKVPKFVSGWISILPLAGAILLPACAAIAIFLYRTALQMRGGDTARFLQCLICYPAMRLVAMLISVDSHLNQIAVLTWLAYAIFHTAPLVFTLALAYRWQITAKATVAMRAEQAAWQQLYPVATSAS